MNRSLFNIILFSVAWIGFPTSLSAQGFSYRSLKSCPQNMTTDLKENEMKEIEDFPSGLYLARSVTQSLEKESEKYISHQRLLGAQDKKAEICFLGSASEKVRTQSLIPTIIDRRPAGVLGHTFWSLSSVLDKATGALELRRSLIPAQDYRGALLAQGFKVISIQKSHDVFQIRLERIISSWKEVVIIHYDQF
jgi:hypothetical protein